MRNASPIPTKMKSALALLQQEKLDQAAAICHDILEAAPKHFDALHMLGVIKSRAGLFDSALDYLDQALQVDPGNAEARKNRQIALTRSNRDRIQAALALHQRGKLSQAEEIYCAVLERDRDNLDALQLLGAIAALRRQHVVALEYLDRALALKPDFAEAHNNRGTALHELKRLDEALAAYDRAIALKPDYAEAHNNRGLALKELKRPNEALAAYDRALALNPCFAEAHNNRGIALKELKRLDEAMASYDRALALRPDYVLAHNNRGIALQELKQLDEALAAYDRALALKPDHVLAHNNRGTALKELKRLDEAMAAYDRALALKPDYAEAHNNRGVALKELKRLNEAMAAYDRALALKPDYAEAHTNEGLLRLLMGDFDTGWRQYEWRWLQKDRTDQPRDYSEPLWLGDAKLQGKRILLYAEQGLGDSIQFCRYAERVAALGAHVILDVPRSLAPLLRELNGVAELIDRGSTPPPFDFHCPLLSLPLAFKTRPDTITGAPYLAAAPKRVAAWHKALGRSAQARVGIAWSGRAEHDNDRNRSIPLLDFEPTLVQGIDYVCLQKEIRSEDRTVLAKHPEIRLVEKHLRDFGDTAALVECMDLVITVDTSVAHLAGALGKEVWILLSFVPDWRWLLDRVDSPWYDSAMLFRQPAIGDWASVFRAVRQRLAARFGIDLEPGGMAVVEEEAPVPSRQSSSATNVPPQALTSASASATLKSAHDLFQAGKPDQASALCRKVLKDEPRYFDALHLLGVIHSQAKNFQLGLDYLDQALRIAPDNVDAIRNRQTAARQFAREKIQAAVVRHRGGDLSGAEDIYHEVLEQNPDNFDALQLLGTLAGQTQRLELAVAYLDRAIALKPDHAEVHSGRGNVLKNLKRFDEALASYDRAIALKPEYAEAHDNRGNALMDLKRFDEALASYDRAIVLRPDFAEAHNNRGNALMELRRFGDALASYDCAIALKPDHAEAHWNEAPLRLLLGDFAGGWQNYEWRWKLKEWTEQPRAYPQPLWLGDADLHGMRILLWAEQGLGDSLQFCRYVAQVAALGAVVVLEAPAALAPLLKPLSGVAEFVAKGEALPPFDFHCPLPSLPLAFNTTLDSLSGQPYLAAPPKRVAAWGKSLGKTAQARVGLAWSGSMGHKNDHNRSIPLSRFCQALPLGIEYIRLQEEVRAEDRAWLARHPEIRSFDARLKDFGDTAALIEAMDLVIAVDTSVAHLAGALGKEVWILLPFVPDWRWLLDRVDSPWYDSATLFRQPAVGDWDSVLREVRQRLAARFLGQTDADSHAPLPGAATVAVAVPNP